MMFTDVVRLRQAEASGEEVVSWYARALWDMRKGDVADDETALRLSKLLRDNRHTVMAVLKSVAAAGHLAFLVTYLELGRADYEVDFKELRVENHITRFSEMIHAPRETKYAVE